MNNSWRSAGGAACFTRNTLALFLCLFIIPCFVCPHTASGQAIRTQTVTLVPGWNAVYIEVDPLVPEPAGLFDGTPVDIVAALLAPARGAQFARNPNADLLGAYGWTVWYAPHRSDTFLSGLYAVQGAVPYLIHSATNATLEITGRVAPVRQVWTPNAYNFVGFPVVSPGGPTFQQFFGASPAHQHNRIYRMKNGIWRQVLDPSSEVMRSGEAFWIFCRGRSDYTGPLQVETPTFSGLLLTDGGPSDLVFRNQTAHPLSFTVEHIVDQNDAIPMAVSILATDDEATLVRSVVKSFPAGPWIQEFPPLEAGRAIRFPVELRLQETQSGVRHSLLRVQTDLGTETYVSVTSYREDGAE